MTRRPIPVSLPDPEHSHFNTATQRFMTHSHPHDGPHRHGLANGRPVVVHQPGNYSPKAAR